MRAEVRTGERESIVTDLVIKMLGLDVSQERHKQPCTVKHDQISSSVQAVGALGCRGSWDITSIVYMSPAADACLSTVVNSTEHKQTKAGNTVKHSTLANFTLG